MGPSPTWLYLLIVASFIIEDTAFYAWLRRNDNILGDRNLTLLWSGVVAYLAGRGLDEATGHTSAWLGDVASFITISGLALLLVLTFSMARSAWRKRGQRQPHDTDPVVDFEEQRRSIAWMGICVSMVMAAKALDPEMGLVIGVTSMLMVIILPLLVRYAKPA